MTVRIYISKRFFPIVYCNIYNIWYKNGYLYLSNRQGLTDRYCRLTYEYFEVDWRGNEREEI